jgi:hypothetical protein
MAKSVSKSEIELHPDAWERFERAVTTVAKAPPQHRKSAKPKAKPRKAAKTKGRK